MLSYCLAGKISFQKTNKASLWLEKSYTAENAMVSFKQRFLNYYTDIFLKDFRMPNDLLENKKSYNGS